MKKLASALFLALGFQFALYGSVNAIPKDEQPIPLEESLTEIGYESVEESVKAFEDHFNMNLKLPLKVPPITFTHVLGRFRDLGGENNEDFELVMMNEKIPINHYKIIVRPIENRIPIKSRYVLDTYELKNGHVAIYMAISGINALVFKRDGWQYMLSIDKRISNVVTPEVLVDIANSIDYPPERRD